MNYYHSYTNSLELYSTCLNISTCLSYYPFVHFCRCKYLAFDSLYTRYIHFNPRMNLFSTADCLMRPNSMSGRLTAYPLLYHQSAASFTRVNSATTCPSTLTHYTALFLASLSARKCSGLNLKD